MVLAAIDFGSNAIRMIIAEKKEQGFRTLTKFREPIRLGQDVFSSGKISEAFADQAIHCFQEFAQSARAHHVEKIRAVGTSALRDATNSKDFIRKILNSSGIEIEIIDGRAEAELALLAIRNTIDIELSTALLIDVGGGSIEITLTHLGCVINTQSFALGGVRLLEKVKSGLVLENNVAELVPQVAPEIQTFFSELTKISTHIPDFAVGTGGTFDTLNFIQKSILLNPKDGILTLEDLRAIALALAGTTKRQRQDKWDLKPDRADVILIAVRMVEFILNGTQTNLIKIPGVGLKEGLIWSLM